jgi:hypothetical protein
MNTALFNRFAPIIRSLNADELAGSQGLDEKLKLAGDGNIRVCYVPFEYINPDARIVIVGITPGRTQLVNAIKEARRLLELGANANDVLVASKQTGAFSGPMRPNLTNLLDSVGLNRWLDIPSCKDLFGSSAHLVHSTSILRNPVFVNGDNYNGTPNMTRHPFLREQLLTYFAEDAKVLRSAVFIPLGDKVAEALRFAADNGLLDHSRILDGLPHPSGANAERIAYFLGNKKRTALSAKTDPNKLDHAKRTLVEKVLTLPM